MKDPSVFKIDPVVTSKEKFGLRIMGGVAGATLGFFSLGPLLCKLNLPLLLSAIIPSVAFCIFLIQVICVIVMLAIGAYYAPQLYGIVAMSLNLGQFVTYFNKGIADLKTTLKETKDEILGVIQPSLKYLKTKVDNSDNNINTLSLDISAVLKEKDKEIKYIKQEVTTIKNSQDALLIEIQALRKDLNGSKKLNP